MGVEVEETFEEPLEDVLLDSAPAIEKHILSHLFPKVVLRIKALYCFMDYIHDSFHWLRQECGRFRYGLVLDSEGV